MPPDILVIEDNPPLRRMVAATLRASGYAVREASDGRDGLEQATEALPALVIQDLLLPDTDASDLLGALRSLPGAASLPILAVSGSREKLRSFQAGPGSFDEMLLKPVGPHQWTSTVERHLHERKATRRFGDGRTVVLADDSPVQQKLTRIRLEQCGFIVTTANNGAQALRAAREIQPDLIISDVLMPELDGFELCRAVRDDAELRRTPVILLSSSYVSAEDRRLATGTGATWYLERTPDLARMITAAEDCMSRRIEPIERNPDFDHEHLEAVRAQLDRQLTVTRDLEQHLETNAIDLAVIAGIASLLARSSRGADVLGEVLTRCLEVASLDAAVILLRDRTGQLALSAQAGASAPVETLRRRMKLETDPELEAGAVRKLPATRVSGPGVVLALGAGSQSTGLLAMAWGDAVLSEPRMTFARAIASQITEALELRRTLQHLELARQQTVFRLALAAECRDDDTAAHNERVGTYAELLARRLGLDEARAQLLSEASVLHDVGKIGVSDTILLKPGKLSADEFERMKLHTTAGHRILAGSHVDLLDLAASIALTHHERFDGNGYPNGLRGEEIPLAGRIVAVADVFDALTSDRVYRPALTIDEAVSMMLDGRGTQFDPQVLDAFVENLDEILALRGEHRRP
jgi:response regulator RpfG family c-di-GMP phosphodiesterase